MKTTTDEFGYWRIAVVSKTIKAFKEFAKSNTGGYPLLHVRKKEDVLGINLFGFVLLDEKYPDSLLMNAIMSRIESRHTTPKKAK